ncbi:MAG: transposase [Acidobacteriota bacterium]
MDSGGQYLFVIDGSKALRSAIARVFGADSAVQRCRLHKERNVCEKLPEGLAREVKSEMRAAYQLPYEKAVKRLKKRAEWLESTYPEAAASLREGLEETLTINRLQLRPLTRCVKV